jgi:hypothetical protein
LKQIKFLLRDQIGKAILERITDGRDLIQILEKREYLRCFYHLTDTPTLKTAEITGRKGDMQINPDGTKTMETGGKKMIYQWNDDLNIVTQQTEEEILINTISATAD